jgi:hypothetical protein
MSLVYTGTLDAKKTGTYEGRSYAVLQFIERDERGSIKLVEINLPDGADHGPFKTGQQVSVPVRVSAKGGKIYYRATDEVDA